MDHFHFNVHAQNIGTENFCQENLMKILILIPRKVKKVLFQKQFLIKILLTPKGLMFPKSQCLGGRETANGTLLKE